MDGGGWDWGRRMKGSGPRLGGEGRTLGACSRDPRRDSVAKRSPSQRGRCEPRAGPLFTPSPQAPIPFYHPSPSSQPKAPLHLHLSLRLSPTAFSTSPHPSAPGPPIHTHHRPVPSQVLFHKCRVAFSSCHGDPRPITQGPGQVPLLRWPDLVSRPSPEQEGELPAPLPAQPPAQPGPPPCSQHAENGEYPQPGLAKGATGGATLKRTEEAMPVPDALSPGRVGQQPVNLPTLGPRLVAGGRGGGPLLPPPPERQPFGFSLHPFPLPRRPEDMERAGVPSSKQEEHHKRVPAGWEASQGGRSILLGVGGVRLVCDQIHCFFSSLSRRLGGAPSQIPCSFTGGRGAGYRVSHHSLGASGLKVSSWGPETLPHSMGPQLPPPVVTVEGAREGQCGAGRVPHDCFP